MDLPVQSFQAEVSPELRPRRGRRLWLVVLILIAGLACEATDPLVSFLFPIAVSKSQFLNPGRPASCSAEITALSGRYAPLGEAVHMFQAVEADSPVTWVWTPPPGATSFNFPAAQPEPGGPPFIFRDVPASLAKDGIQISFTAPDLPLGVQTQHFTEVLETRCSDGSVSAAAFTMQVTTGPYAASTTEPVTALPAAQTADVPLWTLQQEANPAITLTTALCEDWLNFLQREEVFIAMRMPAATDAITRSYPLPVLVGPPGVPAASGFSIWDYSNGPPTAIVTHAPLAFRAQYVHFAASALPAAAGEHWSTLGLAATPPLTCPAGLNSGPGAWTNHLQLVADLSGEPASCEGCRVTFYYCYEGETLPPELAPASIQSIQREGVTCLGPVQHLLNADPLPWTLHADTAAWISPTHVLSLPHTVELSSGQYGPLTLTLHYTADLAADWGVYADSGGRPDLSQPITTSLVLERSPYGGGGWQDLWFVAEAPTDTAWGPYTLHITTTATLTPALYVGNTDMIWVGEWVAPRPYRLYLPLILAQ